MFKQAVAPAPRITVLDFVCDVVESLGQYALSDDEDLSGPLFGHERFVVKNVETSTRTIIVRKSTISTDMLRASIKLSDLNKIWQAILVTGNRGLNLVHWRTLKNYCSNHFPGFVKVIATADDHIVEVWPYGRDKRFYYPEEGLSSVERSVCEDHT